MESSFKNVFVETKEGETIQISDLPKEKYEEFMELMHLTRFAYIAAMRTNNQPI